MAEIDKISSSNYDQLDPKSRVISTQSKDLIGFKLIFIFIFFLKKLKLMYILSKGQKIFFKSGETIDLVLSTLILPDHITPPYSVMLKVSCEGMCTSILYQY